MYITDSWEVLKPQEHIVMKAALERVDQNGDSFEPRELYLLGDGKYSIGRGTGVRIWFGDQSVSKQQCVVVWSGERNRHMLRGISETNATKLNDSPLRGSVSLANGDIINAGGVRLRYLVPPPADAEYREVMRSPDPGPTELLD